MATQQVVNEQNAGQASNNSNSNAVDIKASNETYRVYVKLGDDGKIIDKETRVSTAGKDNSAWDKLDKDTNYKLALEQSIKIYRAGTWSGATQLIEDEEERVNVFNRGGIQKQGQKIINLLTELTDDGTNLKFDPTPGAYDMFELLNEETKRRNLSPEDKAANNLRAAVKAMFPSLEGDQLEAKLAAMFGVMQQ